MSNQPVDAAFDALGEPVRRRIMELLRDGPLPVGRLAQMLPVGRPAVSKHLRVLSDAGLIERHSVGTRNFYRVAPCGLALAQQWLGGMWERALADYADEAGRAAFAADQGPDVVSRKFAITDGLLAANLRRHAILVRAGRRQFGNWRLGSACAAVRGQLRVGLRRSTRTMSRRWWRLAFCGVPTVRNAPLMQSNAGGVLREDPRLDRPDTRSLGRGDQRG